METVEVHSKSYLIRWVHGDPNTIISWKVMPEKRSINFGVFLHDEERANGIQLDKSSGSVTEKLLQSGFRPLSEEGIIRIDGKTAIEGSAKVEKPVMIAFVFDNTFSISQSKHVNFWFSTVSAENKQQEVPTDGVTTAHVAQDAASGSAPAAEQSNKAQVDAKASETNSAVSSPEEHAHGFLRTDSTVSMTSELLNANIIKPIHDNISHISNFTMHRYPNAHAIERRGTTASAKSLSAANDEAVRMPSRTSTFNQTPDHIQISPDGRFVTGYLQKKRRKQFQGFARRYFVLDKRKGLFSYYLNNRAQSLRGVMPIKIVEIKGDEKNLQFTLDSGMERWTLKAYDLKSYNEWHKQIKQLRSSNKYKEESGASSPTTAEVAAAAALSGSSIASNSSTRSRKLPAPDSSLAGFTPLNNLHDLIDVLPEGTHRKNFEQVYMKLLKEAKNVSKKLGDGSQKVDSTVSKIAANTSVHVTHTSKEVVETTEGVLENLKREVESNNFRLVCGSAFIISCFVGIKFTVTFLTIVILSIAGGFISFTKEKERKSQHEVSNQSTTNEGSAMEPTRSTDDNASVYSSIIDNNSEGAQGSVKEGESTDSSDFDMSDSEDEDTPASTVAGDAKEKENGSSESVASPEAPKEHEKQSLYPLPHSPVKRRSTITPPSEAPPSLMSMIRKAKQKGNLGAPITSNEPLSGIEFVAELFENSDLLDKASDFPAGSQQRSIYVAVFMVSRLSGLRVKDRSLRKPFTPLLGESYEMVREDLGLRFIGEKVMHKPEVIATQTDSEKWTVNFTSRPHTKMWAKSAQLTDVGTFRVTFPDGEHISFINPEMFIRNIIGGERYIEPTGTVTVESSSGVNSTVEFKAGGMFSGRSEDVVITCGKLVYEGKWTDAIYHGSNLIWKAKPTVSDPANHYGWTVFCTQLNEITELEKNQLPPNDSRLRPDLRLYEHQTNNEKAEEIKLELEQHQRERRAVMEKENKQHEPFFFKKTNDADGHYTLYSGKRNYWRLREGQNWSSIPNYFK